jgi:hypothetical protein
VCVHVCVSVCVCVCSHGILHSHKEKQNYVVCKKVDGAGDHNIEQDKPSKNGQMSYAVTDLWNLDLKW